MYNYNYGNTNPTVDSSFSSALNGLTGGLIVLAVLLLIVLLVVVVLIVIAECKVFTKAGEKWWKVFIPLYNSWVQIKIACLAWWWFPIFLVATMVTASEIEDITAIGGIMVALTSFNVNYNLAKKFGKGGGYAFLLTFLPFIGYPMLGFGSAQYEKDAVVDKNGIFSIEK